MMKKFESLGRSLTRDEMRGISGGLYPPGDGSTCTYTYSGSNTNGTTRTCDYTVVCNGDSRPPLCETECMAGCGSDGTSCTVTW